MKKVFLYLLLIVLLGCRNEEFLLENVNYQEEISRKFSVFTAQSPNETIDYAKGFEILAKRYDSIYNRDFIGAKALRKWSRSINDATLSEVNPPVYVDFNVRSQPIELENGDRCVFFPKIKGGKVEDLYVGLLTRGDTEVYFYDLDKSDEVYVNNIKKFERVYETKKIKSRLLNKGKIKNGDGDSQPFTLIETVYIEVIYRDYRPYSNITFIGSWVGSNFGNYGGDYGDEFIGGNCSIFESCGSSFYNPKPTKPEQPKDPCEKNNQSKNTANNIFQNNEVKQKMDNVLRNKIGAENEWAIAIGQNPDGSYSVSSPLEGGRSSGYIPDVPSGQYIADGHTHRNTGTPSGGDFYGMLHIMAENPHYTTRFVYGEHFDKKEVYALVVVDRDLAKKFLEQYPRDRNYDEDKHDFSTNTNLGEDYHRIKLIGYRGYYNYNEVSKNNYSDRAIAMAYILEKYNTGLSLLKADKKGNFQAFRVSDADHNSFGGSKKAGAKVSNCP